MLARAAGPVGSGVSERCVVHFFGRPGNPPFPLLCFGGDGVSGTGGEVSVVVWLGVLFVFCLLRY